MTQQTDESFAEGTFENEVFVLPGRCVAWECYAAVTGDGIACPKHSLEFETGRTEARTFTLTPEDLAMKETMSAAEWSRYRKRAYMRHRREADPDYCPGSYTRESALKRATAARMAQADIGRAARREMILANLEKRGFVRTADIIEQFGVSADIVKTQLVAMSREGVLERIYGGARAPGSSVKGGDLRRPNGSLDRTSNRP